jgi:hypothetical protein
MCICMKLSLDHNVHPHPAPPLAPPVHPPARAVDLSCPHGRSRALVSVGEIYEPTIGELQEWPWQHTPNVESDVESGAWTTQFVACIMVHIDAVCIALARARSNVALVDSMCLCRANIWCFTRVAATCARTRGVHATRSGAWTSVSSRSSLLHAHTFRFTNKCCTTHMHVQPVPCSAAPDPCPGLVLVSRILLDSIAKK